MRRIRAVACAALIGWSVIWGGVSALGAPASGHLIVRARSCRDTDVGSCWECRPLARVGIRVHGKGSLLIVAATDSDGIATIERLPVGAYSVSAVVAGARSKSVPGFGLMLGAAGERGSAIVRGNSIRVEGGDTLMSVVRAYWYGGNRKALYR